MPVRRCREMLSRCITTGRPALFLSLACLLLFTYKDSPTLITGLAGLLSSCPLLLGPELGPMAPTLASSLLASRWCPVCHGHHPLTECCTCGQPTKLVFIPPVARAICSCAMCGLRYASDDGNDSDQQALAIDFTKQLCAVDLAERPLQLQPTASDISMDLESRARARMAATQAQQGFCPGLRQFKHLACCCAQGVLHRSHVDAALTADPMLSVWHPELRQVGHARVWAGERATLRGKPPSKHEFLVPLCAPC
jgi:hypothetical protein